MKIYFTPRYFLIGCVVFLSSAASYAQQTSVIIGKRTSPIGIISFSASASLSETSNSKHIDGYVRKYGNTQFTFPVGDNGVYRPFAAAADGTTGAYFQEDPGTATVPSAGPFVLDRKESSLAKISNKEFWDIEGTNATKITISWNAASDISALTGNSLPLLTIVGWNATASRWDKILSSIDNTSITGSASSAASGSITTSQSISPNTYSIYTLGAGIAPPLPVTLVSFKAIPEDSKSVKLTWSTTYETNSQQFDVEHSLDAKSWNALGSVSASKESKEKVTYNFLDTKPGSGENFYRLKMIDQDGTFAFSRIESVILKGGNDIVLYPNPVVDRLYLNSNNTATVSNVSFYNLSGSKVLSAGAVNNSGIDVSRLASGMYLINVSLSDGTSHSTKIIVSK